MRLWHYRLIPYLPNLQLVAQWRELNSIFKNQPSHILINYVYEENPIYLFTYSCDILHEMRKRKIKINSTENVETYFSNYGIDPKGIYAIRQFPQHDDRYLRQCFYNLQEKYDRGQKGFTEEIYMALVKFVKSKLEDI